MKENGTNPKKYKMQLSVDKMHPIIGGVPVLFSAK
jgi:hypothetical protein